MQTLLLILNMIPALIKAVKAAEEFIPLPGEGAKKLDMILGIIGDVYEEAGKIVPLVTKAIARIVAAANFTGVFPKEG
jgi:hypothetical protein